MKQHVGASDPRGGWTLRGQSRGMARVSLYVECVAVDQVRGKETWSSAAATTILINQGKSTMTRIAQSKFFGVSEATAVFRGAAMSHATE
jgi:hypothetical protein